LDYVENLAAVNFNWYCYNATIKNQYLHRNANCILGRKWLITSAV